MFVKRDTEVRAADTSFGNVDHDRTRPARAGQVKRFVNDGRQIPHVADQVVVLNAGTRDSYCVNFLESVGADKRRGTWPVITTIGVESM